MFDILSGLLSYNDESLSRLKSKKVQAFVSLFFGFLIFLSICVKEFFENSDSGLIIFSISVSVFSSVFVLVCFFIADFLKKI